MTGGEKSCRIAAVIFDWDGVLLDSLGAAFNVYDKIFARMGTRRLARDEFLQLQSPNWYEFYSKVGVPAGQWKEVDDEWLRLYGEENPALYPDARGCMADLRASGLRLALVSNGSEMRVEREVRRFGLASSFESFLCGRSREELKPSPLMLQKTVGVLGLGPEDVIYVGDAPADIEAARNAGVASVAIAREEILRNRLRAENPDHLFGGLEDLTKFLVDSKIGDRLSAEDGWLG